MSCLHHVAQCALERRFCSFCDSAAGYRDCSSNLLRLLQKILHITELFPRPNSAMLVVSTMMQRKLGLHGLPLYYE